MILLLYILGVITLIVGLITGFMAYSTTAMLITFLGGVSSAIVLFALARILDNQENIMLMMDRMYSKNNKPPSDIVCKKCEYKYTDDYSSCPNCGYKPQ